MNIGMAQGLLFHKGQLYVGHERPHRQLHLGPVPAERHQQRRPVRPPRTAPRVQRRGRARPARRRAGPRRQVAVHLLRQFHRAAAVHALARAAAVWRRTNCCRASPTRRGHANRSRPPAAGLRRTDLDGNNLELVSVGYRNTYDIAFNADGELFTFDSDMEWDIGTPWYRPTRVCHVDQRQRLRLAQRQRRVAGVLPRHAAGGRRRGPGLAHRA